MLEMSSVGAQVLEPRSVSLAKKNNLLVHKTDDIVFNLIESGKELIEE